MGLTKGGGAAACSSSMSYTALLAMVARWAAGAAMAGRQVQHWSMTPTTNN